MKRVKRPYYILFLTILLLLFIISVIPSKGNKGTVFVHLNELNRNREKKIHDYISEILKDTNSFLDQHINANNIFNRSFKSKVREHNYESHLGTRTKDGNITKMFEERQVDLYLPKPFWGQDIDVDKDNKKEKIYYYSIAMTQSPHIVQIVKDNGVIFEFRAPKINLEETSDQDGFFLNQNEGLQGNLYTRYKFEKGKFIKAETGYKK